MPLRGESLTWGDNQQQRLEKNGAAQGEPARHQVSTLQGSRLTLAASHPRWRSGLFLQVHAGEGWAGKVKLGGQGECPPEPLSLFKTFLASQAKLKEDTANA